MIVTQDELKHEITVSQKSWFVRLYLKIYDASVDDITFCKMFWGYVFAPVVLFLLGVAAVVHLSLDLKHKVVPAKPAKPSPVDEVELEELTQPSRALVLLEKLIKKVSVILSYKASGYALVGLGVLIGAAAATTVIILIVNNPVVSLEVLGFIVAVAVLTLGFIFATESKKVQSGFLTFGGLLKGGYKAVKTNTCPRITVK